MSLIYLHTFLAFDCGYTKLVTTKLCRCLERARLRDQGDVQRELKTNATTQTLTRSSPTVASQKPLRVLTAIELVDGPELHLRVVPERQREPCTTHRIPPDGVQLRPVPNKLEGGRVPVVFSDVLLEGVVVHLVDAVQIPQLRSLAELRMRNHIR